MTHYYDDWRENNREKKAECKWRNSNRYCWCTRYGCIDCYDYEPVRETPEVDEWIKPFIKALNGGGQ